MKNKTVNIDKNVFNLLNERSYVYQLADISAIKRILESDNQITFYLGIDPTADSLHIGHFFALMMFRYLQEAGHKGILVIGGAALGPGEGVYGEGAGTCGVGEAGGEVFG
jgi:tyrosyl-tRNA synthetase